MIPAKCKEARAQICQGFRSLQADEEIFPRFVLDSVSCAERWSVRGSTGFSS